MAQDYNLGTAYGSIELNASSLSRAASGFDLLGNKMLLIGGAAVAAFGYMVKSAAGFEQQMSRFEAVGNATEGQMDKIREKALQLGRDSAYGATEVVQAFSELAYAGASVHEIMSGLGDATVYLAAAGEIPLADAAKDLIVTLDQFGLKGKDSVRTANDLARAANASTASISDLVTSLRYVGTVAGPLGFKFRDVSQALAILANEGLRGSTAGTSLRGILVGITKPSEAATEAMRQLGIITLDGSNQFFDAAGHIKSMAEIAEVLKTSTQGLTDKEKANAFATIFQRRAMAAALDLARGGKKAFDDLSGSQQYNTTAQEIMKKKLDNLNGSIKILKASFETFAIVVGSKFTPFFKVLADVLREVTNAFIKLPGPVQTLIGATLAFGGGGLVVVGTLSKLAAVTTRTYKGLNDVGAGFKLLKGMMSNFVTGLQTMGATLLANPIFLLIVVLVALAVAFYLLYTKSETFRRGIHRIGEAAKVVGKWLKEAFMDFLDWVKANWPDLVLILLGPLGLAIIGWRHFKDQIKAVVQDVIDWVKNNWDIILAVLTGPFGLFVLFIRRWGDDFVNFLKDVWDSVLSWIEGRVNEFWTAIKNAWNDALTWITQTVTGFWEDIKGLWNDAITAIKDRVNEFWTSIKAAWNDALTWITQTVIGFWDDLKQLWDDALNLIKEKVRSALQSIIDFFTELPGRVFGALAGLGGMLLDLFGGALGSAIGAVAYGIGIIAGWFGGLPGRILDAIGDLGGLLWGVGRDIIQGLINGLDSLIGTALGKISDFANKAKHLATHPWEALSPSRVMIELGRNIVQGMVIGIEREAGSLKRTMAALGPQGLGMGLRPGQPGYSDWKLANYGGMTGTQMNRGDTNINIYNPVGEPAEESLSRRMQSLAYVGVVG